MLHGNQARRLGWDGGEGGGGRGREGLGAHDFRHHGETFVTGPSPRALGRKAVWADVVRTNRLAAVETMDRQDKGRRPVSGRRPGSGGAVEGGCSRFRGISILSSEPSGPGDRLASAAEHRREGRTRDGSRASDLSSEWCCSWLRRLVVGGEGDLTGKRSFFSDRCTGIAHFVPGHPAAVIRGALILPAYRGRF